MANKNVIDAINGQINSELSASYSYLAMSAWCEGKNFTGSSRWLRLQSQEEYLHAMKLFDFVLARGGNVQLKAIDEPRASFTSLADVFEKALEQEHEVGREIDSLYELAFKEKAFAAVAELQWFLTEQVEEEKVAREIRRTLQAGGQRPGVHPRSGSRARRPAERRPAAADDGGIRDTVVDIGALRGAGARSANGARSFPARCPVEAGADYLALTLCPRWNVSGLSSVSSSGRLSPPRRAALRRPRGAGAPSMAPRPRAAHRRRGVREPDDPIGVPALNESINEAAAEDVSRARGVDRADAVARNQDEAIAVERGGALRPERHRQQPLVDAGVEPGAIVRHPILPSARAGPTRRGSGASRATAAHLCRSSPDRSRSSPARRRPAPAAPSPPPHPHPRRRRARHERSRSPGAGARRTSRRAPERGPRARFARPSARR